MKYNNVITLAKFLTRYLGIVGEDIKNLTHEDIKFLFPNIKRATFAYIEKYPGAVNSGNVLLVNDGKKTIPYYAPTIIQDREVTIHEYKRQKEEKKRVTDYTSMRIFELKELLNIRLNGYSTSRQARRELEDRGVVLRKKYNREEFKKWRRDYERD